MLSLRRCNHTVTAVMGPASEVLLEVAKLCSDVNGRAWILVAIIGFALLRSGSGMGGCFLK